MRFMMTVGPNEEAWLQARSRETGASMAEILRRLIRDAQGSTEKAPAPAPAPEHVLEPDPPEMPPVVVQLQDPPERSYSMIDAVEACRERQRQARSKRGSSGE